MDFPRIIRKSANYTARHGETVLMDATAGARTVTLPAPVWGQRAVQVIKTDLTANAVTVTAGTPLLDGATTHVLSAPYQAVTVAGDGSTWHKLSQVLVAPAPVTIGTAIAGLLSATVAFTPNGNGGAAPTSYLATSSPGGITGTGTSSPVTVSGLTAGTPYTFTVRPSNDLGQGLASSASNSVTPTASPSAPLAPTIGTATAGDTEATANWTAPVSDGGSAITGYVVKTYDTSGTLLATDTVGVVLTFTKTGLTNGTGVKFKVAAINAIGTGTLSSFSNTVTPATVFDPADLSPLLWLKADAGTTGATSDGDAITTWVDQSGNGNDLPAVGAPILKLAIQNGKPVVRFDGVDDAFYRATWVGGAQAQPVTVFLVAIYRGALPGPASAQYLMDSGGNFQFALRALASGIFEAEGAGAVAFGNSIALDHAAHLHTVAFNAASSVIKADGATQSSNGFVGSQTFNGMTVARRGGGASEYCQVDVCEIIVVPGVVSGGDQTSMLAYCQSRWATP